jgi:hypothetical protein
MTTEQRWVTVIDNSLGNIDEMLVVKALVDWYANEGLELSDYASFPVDRLAEGQAVLDLVESHVSGQAYDAIRSEWLEGWIEYILALGDIQIHEELSECYGYWEDTPPSRRAIKIAGQFHCPTCGLEVTEHQTRTGSGWCGLCLTWVAEVGSQTYSCTNCKAQLNNEGYCPDPHCPYSELFEG